VTSKLSPEHLQRRAIIYVRQSTLIQVVKNRESQLRQYHLADYVSWGLPRWKPSTKIWGAPDRG
jgi:hypothetical protein